MKRRSSFFRSIPGMCFRGWTVQNPLGEGGNGGVFLAVRDEEKAAIKFLNPEHWTQPRGERFGHEIEAMRKCTDVPGVLPVLDFNLPETPSEADPPWLVMPLAHPMIDVLEENPPLTRVVDICISIAQTLSQLHGRRVAHRDLKPGNLLLWQDRWCLGDLGLAEYPEKPELTESGEQLGPRHYIAPEMVDAKHVDDARPADVYSMGKLLWKLATGQRFPLAGWYAPGEEVFKIGAYRSSPKCERLDPIISAVTRVEPSKRPTIDVFLRELQEWVKPAVIPPIRPGDLTQHLGILHAAQRSSRAHAAEVQRAKAVRETWKQGIMKATHQPVHLMLEEVIKQVKRYYLVTKGHGAHGGGETFHLELEVPSGIEAKVFTVFFFIERIADFDSQTVTMRGKWMIGPTVFWQHDVSYLPDGNSCDSQMSALRAAILGPGIEALLQKIAEVIQRKS